MQTEPIKNLLQTIDNENIRMLMNHLHLEDYDELLRYAVSIGVRLLPKEAE